MKKTKGLKVCMIMLALFFVFLPIKGRAAESKKELKVSIQQGTSAGEIQSVLELANTLDKKTYSGLKVVLEKGTYELDDSLVLYSDTTIVATDCMIIKAHREGPIIRNYLYDQEKEKPYAENITVIGGLWDGAPEINGSKSDELFRFIHAHNIEVRDLTIKNIKAGHLLTLAGVTGAVVDHCTFSGFTVYGSIKEAVHLDLVHSRYMVPVVESSKKLIRYDDAPCKDITVTNCTFHNVPSGVGSHSSVRGVYQENIVIKDNIFTNIETAAVRCYNYKNVTISGNKILRTGIGIQLYTCTANSENMDDNKTSYHIPLEGTKQKPIPEDNNYHIKVENNEIHMVYKGKDKYMGNGIVVTGNEKRPMASLIIKNNTIINTKKYSIKMQYAPEAELCNNELTNGDADGYIGGIQINKSDFCRVHDNLIRYCERGIDSLQSCSGYYVKNEIFNSLYDGIRLNNRSKNSTVANNTIMDTDGTGIAVTEKSDDNLLKKNRIKNANIGIYINDCKKTKLKQNIIKGNYQTKIKQ